MTSERTEKMNVGGQAVIEGVMMRSPDKVSVAVRRPDGLITVKIQDFISVTKKFKVLDWPLIRGGVILLESIILGVEALHFSGEIAIEAEKKQSSPAKHDRKSDWWTQVSLGLMVLFSFAVGLGVFFYVPLLLTQLTGVQNSLLFNLIDGVIRLLFFLLYLYLISQWKEIKRVFEYHGAEHKSIFAFENGEGVSLEAARKYKTYHPRCGTSFLMVVLLVSILVFIFLGRPTSIGERLLRIALVPFIGGLSYEIIKLSDKLSNYKLFRFFIAPGLWLQRITTQEPDVQQLEVAIVALQAALGQTLPENVVVVYTKGK